MFVDYVINNFEFLVLNKGANIEFLICCTEVKLYIIFKINMKVIKNIIGVSDWKFLENFCFIKDLNVEYSRSNTFMFKL